MEHERHSSARDEALLRLRPTIATMIEEGTTSEAERFQNLTLRPILKFQHDLLIDIFRQYCHDRKGQFFRLSAEQKDAYIDQALQRDFRFRNRLLGTVLALFTRAEYREFLQNKGELTRRSLTMLARRYKDSLGELTTAL